jgi:hypothetical protein
MPNVRKIGRTPANGDKNYFLVDANFLANKHIPPAAAPDAHQRGRIESCLAWWKEIEDQLQRNVARVYIPDICIAEAFKVLAKKRYDQKWLKTAAEHRRARNALSDDVRTHNSGLKAGKRLVPYHDISTNRDIIISVDRFFPVFLGHKNTVSVSVPDLIVLATAKYLIEFFDIAKDRLHIVTMDTELRTGSKRLGHELPPAYDPTTHGNRAEVVFCDGDPLA